MTNPFGHLRLGLYGAILADPPLAFKTRSNKGEGRSPQHHYSCLSFEQLAALPVGDLAAPNCFLFLWIPLRSIVLVEPLMRAWGFNFSGAGFAWAKQNKSGVGWFMGTGYGTRHNIEICWLGRRGKPRRQLAGVRELIVAPVREHSRKPDEIYGRIEALCGGPYVELFARQMRPGWDSPGATNSASFVTKPASSRSTTQFPIPAESAITARKPTFRCRERRSFRSQ